MRPLFLALAFALAAVALSPGVTAQTPQTAQRPDPGITANSAIGEVKAIDATSRQMIVKTDAGTLVTVALGDKTIYKRLAPGETTLTNAVNIAFSDVAEGDRVWARGKVSEDHKSVPASAVIVMTKADLAKKHEAERAEWRRRGILGVISALKPESKEITISSRSMMGTQSVVIPVSEKVEMRRYAPDSIKFTDAKPSKFEELKVGDQLRALGERAPDGTHFSAEKVVTGAFRMAAGTVSAVDPASGEIKISELEKKQPLTIVIKQDAVLRKFPPPGEMGGMMAMNRGSATGGGGQTAPAGQGKAADRPQQQGGQGAPGGAQGAGPGGPTRVGGGGFNIQDMLERLPTISITDVKVGDTIIVSSTQGADPTRLTAIALVTGADTLLNMVAARRQQSGGQSAPNPSAGLGSNISFGIGLP